MPDWLGAPSPALTFFQGCPAIIVSDNLRGGVIRAHHYKPNINPAYQALADHYVVAIVPARVRRPKDKVEVGVQIVQRWILARLRHQTLFSIRRQ